MSLSFPASPTVNQTYSFGSSTYKWDGGKWISVVTEPSRLVSGSNSLEINGNNLVWVGGDVSLSDKNIVIGNVASPTNITADGGGVTLKGAVDKTIAWLNATAAWTFSEHISIASAKEYRIAGIKVLDATSLGSVVVGSSLTSVGTIGTGTWQGTAIADTYLGTISTAGKVSNSATTATSALGINTIVARDGSNNFTAGTITAALTGAASSNVLKAGDTMTGALVMPLGVFGTPSLTFTSDPNTGLYSPGADQVAISTGGTAKFTVGSLDGNPIIENNFPTVRPALDLAFAATKRLDPRVTFVRATSATYVGGDGLVKTAGVNEARFDHDPVTGESLGLLVEESRTNYVTGSGGSALFAGYNFSAEAIWTITAASTDVSAPDGSSLTTKAVSGSSGTTYFWRYANSFTHASNTTYTQSVWARVAVGTGSISLTSYPFGQSYYGYDQGNDITTQWKRISVTYTTDSGPSASPYMGVVSPSNNTTFYFWGWQIEQGAFPTSYIPTSGSTVTRSADVASMTGTNFSSWFSSSSGSLVSIAKTPPGVAWRYAQIIGGFGNGIYSQTAEGTGMLVDGFHANGPWQSHGRVWISGVSYSLGGNLNFGYNDYTLQSRNAFIAWSPTESRYGVNGELSSGSSSSMASTVAATVNKFIIGYGDSIDAYYQPPSTVHVKRLTFYPKRLTNQQLQALTT